jgi:hypothetical protein
MNPSDFGTYIDRINKSKWVIRIAGMVVFLTFIKLLVNACSDTGINSDFPTGTSAFSRSKGVFVCEAQVQPQRVIWHSSVITIREAWVEREVKTEHPLVWFHRLKQSGDYLLCFRLQEGQRPIANDNLFFVPVGSGTSFGYFYGGSIFWQTLTPDEFDRNKEKILLRQFERGESQPAFEAKWMSLMAPAR